MDRSEQEQLLALAEKLAEAAKVETLRYFRSGTRADNKELGGFDPVTDGDRAAEAAMRAIIEAARPKDGILGEEHGSKPSQSGLTWVLDPIDGTRGYIAGTPTWGTLIALSDKDGVKLGLIDQPYIGERFLGGFGTARLTGPQGMRDLKTSTITRLEDAILLTTFPEVGTKDEAVAFQRVAARCKLTRYGMDCYGYALVAAGQVDLVIEAGLAPYDIQGPIGVVEAAGGILTDWQGNPAHEGGRALAAATPELHEAALALLNQ